MENVLVKFPTMKARDLRAFLSNCREFKVAAGYGVSHLSSKILKRMGTEIDKEIDTYEFLRFFIKTARRKCPLCGKHHNDTHGVRPFNEEIILSGDLANAAVHFDNEAIKPIILARPAMCEECSSAAWEFNMRSRVRDGGLENFIYSKIKKCRTSDDVKKMFASDKIEISEEGPQYEINLPIEMVYSIAKKLGYHTCAINSRFLSNKTRPIEEIHKSASIIRHVRKKYKIKGDVCRDWTEMKNLGRGKREMLSLLQEYIDHAQTHKKIPSFYGTPNWIYTVFYQALNMDIPIEARLRAYKLNKTAR